MQYATSVESGCNIIQHDASAFWKLFQLPHRRWLEDVKPSKKYKTREESFPRERNRDQRDQLACDLVDHHELGVLYAGGAGHACGGRNAGEGDQNG